MSFTANLFITVFLPVVFGFVFLFRKHIKRQNVFLLISNIVFLLFGGVGGVLLLYLTCVVDYIVFKQIRKYEKAKLSNVFFVAGVVLNLIPLLLFKYTGFVIASVNSLFNIGIVIPQWSIPVGISFYTFQSVSLLADIKTKKISYQPKLFDVCFYLSFFTTTTSGPIVRFDSIHAQLNERNITSEGINKGLTRFVTGLGKKVLLSNNLALFVEDVFSSVADQNLSVATYWLGSIAFTLQLYLDFSGYSDMAIGIANVLGFNIPENFNYPYIAKSIGEFWRRWHISLSQWFRDYIYIPLGGNRVSVPKHIANLLVVWCLTGIWHGANWTFIVWGLLYFVLLVFEKYCIKITAFVNNHFIGHIYTLFFVNLLWVFFRADSLSQAMMFIYRMFGFGSEAVPVEISTIHIIPFIIISAVCCFPVAKVFSKYNEKPAFEIIKTALLCIIFIISIFTISITSFTPFIYGAF